MKEEWGGIYVSFTISFNAGKDYQKAINLFKKKPNYWYGMRDQKPSG